MEKSENVAKSDRFTLEITRLGIETPKSPSSVQERKSGELEKNQFSLSIQKSDDVYDVIAESMQSGLLRQRKATLTPIINPRIRRGTTLQTKKTIQNQDLKFSQHLQNTWKYLKEFIFSAKIFRKRTQHNMQINLSKHQLRILKDKTISFEKKPWLGKKADEDDEKAQLKEAVFASTHLRKMQSLSFKFTGKDPRLLQMSTREKLLKKLNKIKVYLSTPISPDNAYKMIWDISAAFFIIYEMILTPFKISFSIEDTTFMSNFEQIMDAYFLMDICLNFYTAYYDKGNVVYAKGAIAKNYLKCWFWIDLVASFPYTQILPGDDAVDSSSTIHSGALKHSASIVKLLRIFRFIKVVKLLRLAKLRRVLEILQSYFTLPAWILDIFKVIMVVFTFAHWLGCIWHFLAVSEGTMYETTWLTKKGIVDQSTYVQYVSSLYWATLTMTTVGYGDSVPITPLEASMSTVTNVISGVLFAYTMNKVNSILTGDDQISEAQRDSILLITNYMRKHQVPIWLQIRVKTYLKYTGENESSFNDHQKVIHKYLNEAFREELLFEAMGKFLLEKRFFRDFEGVFLRKVINIMEEKMLSPEDTVFLEGSVDDLSLYYVNSGKIQIFMLNSETRIKNLGVGDCFGEIGFFTGMERTASARAIDFSSLYYINREKFLSLLNSFPEEKEKYCEKKDKVAIIGNLSWILVACYACQSQGHLARDCPKLHFVFDKEQFLQESFSSHEEFCKDYLRRNRRVRFLRKEIQEKAANFQQQQQKVENPSISEESSKKDEEKPKIRVNPIEKNLTPLMRFRKVARLIQFQARIGLMARRSNYFEIGFDKVANFTYYFTHNNIEYISPASQGFGSEVYNNIDSPLLFEKPARKARKSLFANQTLKENK